MWRDLKAAYRSWWSLLAMLFSAISIFNYVSRVLHISLSQYFSDVVEAYQALFYPIVEFVVSPFHLDILDWQKDLILVWLAIGGATSRTFWSEFATNARIAKDPDSIRRSDYWDSFRWALISIVAWPICWIWLFLRPYYYMHKRRDGRPLFVGRWHVNPTRNGIIGSSADASIDHEVIADMRVVLLIQILSVALVVIALSIANAVAA